MNNIKRISNTLTAKTMYADVGGVDPEDDDDDLLIVVDLFPDIEDMVRDYRKETEGERESDAMRVKQREK